MDRNHNINTLHIVILLKAYVLGFLFGDITIYFTLIGSKLGQYFVSKDLEYIAIVGSVTYSFVVVLYAINRDLTRDLRKLLQSKRFDLLAFLLIGAANVVILKEIIYSQYYITIYYIPDKVLLMIISIPFFTFVTLLLKIRFSASIIKNDAKSAFFIDDKEQLSSTDDLLNISPSAEKFAERIMNLESSSSMVFGIDAPWGAGKSSFINFCKEYWSKKNKEKTIVYTFNPLRYEGREKLFERFVDGFIEEIRKSIFIPELKPVYSKYVRMISSLKGTLGNMFSLEVTPESHTVDDAYDELEEILGKLDKKIIVIIDDLDRLNITAVKDLLFTIKKSFTLPNVTYVLCYDIENINTFENNKPDSEKISEFLEKFINVKVGLYLSSKVLDDYIAVNLKHVLSRNPQASPILVSKAIGGIRDIFKSKEYYKYSSLIGDIRKLKRLINLVLLLDLDKIDFENSDFNTHDLAHLLLIYINYPAIFRTIYNSETSGKKGIFSLVTEMEDGFPSNAKTPGRNELYSNSTYYDECLKSMSPSQQFVVKKIFNADQRLNTRQINAIPIEVRTSYACFNGSPWASGNRNLEDYLNLIVSSSRPIKTDQYKFYENVKINLINTKSLEEILEDQAFQSDDSESVHTQLWKTIVNSADEFPKSVADSIIKYLVHNITKYSYIEHQQLNVGLRNNLCIYLVKLLDQAGWIDEDGKHHNNNEENTKEIVDWIFGKNAHKNDGILMTLSSVKRGVIGIHDLLAFRLYCSANRGGDVYNLTRALALDSNPAAPSDGNSTTIAVEEMRKISQKVFNIFKTRYIDPGKDIFKEANSLAIEDITGKSRSYILERIEESDCVGLLEQAKARLLAFIIYQLGSTSTEYGVSCGYYDAYGLNDKHGISREISKYLFSTCFSPTRSSKNYENYLHFINYLIDTYIEDTRTITGKFNPTIEQLTKVLNKEQLQDYWKKHFQKIKALNLHKSAKNVYTVNHTLQYKTIVPALYKILNTLL